MRIYNFGLSLIICLFVMGAVRAQKTDNIAQKRDSLLNNITNIKKRIQYVSSKDTSSGFSITMRIDTLPLYELNQTITLPKRDEKGLLVSERIWEPFDNDVSFRDTIIFDPAFLPVIFDGKVLPDKMNFMPRKTIDLEKFQLISRDSTFAPNLDRAQHIENMRRYYYMNNPQRVEMNVFNFEDPEKLREAAFVEKKNIFKELLTADDPISISKPEVEKIEIKPVYWIKKGEHSLLVNQNSFSENWSAGGNNNFSVSNYHKITFNYKKKKISLNNTFEWRLNLQQNSADKIHKINITDDYVKTYSVLGISSFIKKWSYTATLGISTPLFNGYPLNSETKVRALFSPLIINTGVGMGYTYEKISKKDKFKNLKLTLEPSPLSINYTIVGDKGVNVTKYGIDSGKKSQLDFGSTLNANLAINFNRFSSFTSRLKYFTNYNKVLMESENKFTLALSRFLSSSIYYYLRFDDSVGYANKNKGWGYFQYSEVAGFGLSYTW